MQYYKDKVFFNEMGSEGKTGQVILSNLLNTTFRISRSRVISFMLRVLKKAVNLESSLSNAWFLDNGVLYLFWLIVFLYLLKDGS